MRRNEVNMKGEIKKKYQEYVNHIDFPTILYIYETNRVIAMNEEAMDITGMAYDDIRDMFKGKKYKLSKELLEREGQLIMNTVINSREEELVVDIDMNVIEVDNVHFVLMLFEKTTKNFFNSNKSIQLPRISWKYENYVDIYMNSMMKYDLEEYINERSDIESFRSIDISHLRYSDIVKIIDTDIIKRLDKLKDEIIDGADGKYNTLLMLNGRKHESKFIKISLMPILNNKGRCVGILSVYNNILKKNEQRNLFDMVSSDDIVAYNIYENILNSLNNEIIVCLENRKIGYINNECKNNYDDICGMDIFEFFNRYRFINARAHEGRGLANVIDEGFAFEKKIQVLMYDGFNNRYIAINFQKIKWKDNSYALLLTFNDNYRHVVYDVEEKCIIKK